MAQARLLDAPRKPRRRNFSVPLELGVAVRYRTEVDRRASIKKLLNGTPEGELWAAHLTRHQKTQAYKTGWVPVIGSEGGKYLVGVDPEGGQMLQVFYRSPRMRNPRGLLGRHFCLNVFGDLSLMDTAISKILLIEADELLFRKTARG